jgi:hypothetical protein
MAQYGYSTPYSGQQVAPLPPGYMEAATAPGRNLAMGITAIGQGLGKAIERYTENKKGHEALDETNTAVTKMYLQQMESDPKVQAVRYFEDTGKLPTGVDETTLKSYEAQMKRDAGMISNLVGNSNKWADMSLTKKQAALGQTVTMLNQYRTNQQDDLKNEATRQALASGALQLSQAQKQAEAAPFLTKAMLDIASRKPGQGPSVPYANVTEEMIGKYGNKLTPEMLPSFIQQIQRMNQTLPAGLVPTGAKMGPAGMETEYGVPQTLTSVPLEGSTKLRQQLQGGKAVGAPYVVDVKTNNEYLNLSEPQQKAVEDLSSKFQSQKTIQNLSIAGSFFNSMNELGVGTKKYTPSDDIALVFSFMKTLDPTSTVGPTEYATASKAGGVPEAIRNTYNKLRDGEFLTDEQRRNFIETARKNYNGISKEAENVARTYRSMASDRGVPEHLVVPKNMFQQTKEFNEKNAAQTMQRFQSPADMKAAGVTRGLVFNPANGKYSEYIQD